MLPQKGRKSRWKWQKWSWISPQEGGGESTPNVRCTPPLRQPNNFCKRAPVIDTELCSALPVQPFHSKLLAKNCNYSQPRFHPKASGTPKLRIPRKLLAGGGGGGQPHLSCNFPEQSLKPTLACLPGMHSSTSRAYFMQYRCGNAFFSLRAWISSWILLWIFLVSCCTSLLKGMTGPKKSTEKIHPQNPWRNPRSQNENLPWRMLSEIWVHTKGVMRQHTTWKGS